MVTREKVLCSHDFIRFMTEEKLIGQAGKDGIISISSRNNVELMIFLGKEENGENYEVRIYKAKPTDKYVRSNSDKFIRYTENDKYASFFFASFDKAKNFIYFLPYFHGEYRSRPSIKVSW